MAVQNPDGTRVVLITNSAWVAHQVKVRLGTEASIHQLPPRSIATIVWPATSGAPNDPNFDGTAVPGVVEAERFGNGGPGVSYYDVSPGNWGGQYRNTDVDIEVTSDSGGGYNVGWLRAGEWMAYPLEVPAGGVYGFEARVASKGVGGTFHIEIDGVDKTGRIAIPNTGDWQSWTTLKLPAVTLSAGRRLMRIVIDTAGPAGDAGNLNFVRVTAPTPPSGGSPFNGTPTPLPGVVEAEMFDEGGNLVAYRDLTPENYGAAFRATAVDIEPATGGGFNIGWMQAGEWLQYTVNVASSGTYRVEARVASLGKGGTFHLEANGANISGPLAIPDTGGWQAWRAITVAVSLAAGTQRVRVILDGNGPGGYVGNLDSLRFTVPTAAGNMALKRPVANSSVESSSYQGIHAVDGNLATRWSSAFSDGQWISVDLGATRTIAQVTLRWETAYARAYQLQVSDDASKWTTIWSTTSGDGGVDDVRNLSARGRHVRVVAERRATSWGNSLWEFEVYGPPQ